METEYGNDTKDTELITLRTSLTNIEGRIAATYATLQARTTPSTQAPIEANVSQTRFTDYQDEKTNKQKEAREKAKARYTHILMDYDSLNSQNTGTTPPQRTTSSPLECRRGNPGKTG